MQTIQEIRAEFEANQAAADARAEAQRAADPEFWAARDAELAEGARLRDEYLKTAPRAEINKALAEALDGYGDADLDR